MEIHTTCTICGQEMLILGVQKNERKTLYCPHCHEKQVVVIRDGKVVKELNEDAKDD